MNKYYDANIPDYLEFHYLEYPEKQSFLRFLKYQELALKQEIEQGIRDVLPQTGISDNSGDAENLAIALTQKLTGHIEKIMSE